LSVFANPSFQTIIDKVEQPTVTVIVGTTLIMNDQAPDDAIDQIDLLTDDDFEGFQNMDLANLPKILEELPYCPIQTIINFGNKEILDIIEDANVITEVPIEIVPEIKFEGVTLEDITDLKES
jgi:hypothetical protein